MSNIDQSDTIDDDRDLRPKAQSEKTLYDATSPEALILQVEGFEGPLDVLLTLARAQKVDLAQISILELVEQYLKFVTVVRKLKLELAADYLVMAAWLAYLKSRLLLPKEEAGDEPSAEELALRLQLRLLRLEAMREAGGRLMGRDRLGRDTFARGNPEGIKILKTGTYDLTLYELLKAYADHHQRHLITEIRIERRPVMALDAALERLTGLIGETYSWTTLKTFLPDFIEDEQLRKSTIASMFAASLELARQGTADIRQMETFGPIYLKHRSADEE